MASIFLADRDEAFRKSLAHTLRARGHEVGEFSSGGELYAETVAGDPDLIVMETDLDDMDGFQVFARLSRKRPERPYPVVFVTEFEHPRVARVLKQRGALGYVGKNRPMQQVAESVHAFVADQDPLSERRLPGALAWLQSRGKSGRLEVESGGERGHVLLHRGRVLEASWKSLRGEDALTLFAEGLSDASFRFAEGVDETDVVPQSAEEIDERERRAEPVQRSAAPAIAAPAALAAAAAAAPAEATEATATTTLGAGAAQAVPPPPSKVDGPGVSPATGGAVAAVRELREARSRRGGGRGGDALRRTLVGAAAAVAILVTLTLAAAAFFPARVPAGLAAILSDLGVQSVERGVDEPAPQLARSDDQQPGGGAPSGEVPASTQAGSPEAGADDRSERIATIVRTDPTSPVLSGAAREGAAGRGELAATPDAAPREPQREAATPPPATPAPAAAAPEREAAAPTEEPAAERPAPRRVAPPPAPPPDEALARTPQPRPRRRAAPAPPPAAPAADEPRPDAALVKRPVLLQRGSEPYFPPELREQGISGSVLLNIRIGANGRAQQVQVMRSSGYEAFDEAAVAAVGTFLWDPARDASGPAETWITQAVTFRP